MKIDEITLLKVTLPAKKEMKALDYWNLGRKSRAALKASIEKCLATGEEQILRDDGVFVYVIRPHFPLIDSAMKEKENADYLKVSISVFTQDGVPREAPHSQEGSQFSVASSNRGGFRMIVHATQGTPVRFWTGLREGEGRIGKLSYDGIHELGGTQCVYIRADEPRTPGGSRSVGAVALTHVEEIMEAAA